MTVGGLNIRVGTMQIILRQTWDCFDKVNKDYDNQFGSRVSKDIVCNVEGRTLTEFCERNILEMLSGNYGIDTKG